MFFSGKLASQNRTYNIIGRVVSTCHLFLQMFLRFEVYDEIERFQMRTRDKNWTSTQRSKRSVNKINKQFIDLRSLSISSS